MEYRIYEWVTDSLSGHIVENIWAEKIIADSPEQAREKYIIKYGTSSTKKIARIGTEQEYQDYWDNVKKEREEWEIQYEKQCAEEKSKKSKKIEKKAKELKLSIEDYKKYTNTKRNRQKHFCEARKAREQIEQLKKEIKEHNAKALYYDEIVKRLEKLTIDK